MVSILSAMLFLSYRKRLVYGKGIKMLKALIRWGTGALSSILIPLSTFV